MTKKVIRYRAIVDADGRTPLESARDGEWVRYDDIKHLLPGEPSVAKRCHCGQYEWPTDCVEIEDSRKHFHYADRPCDLCPHTDVRDWICMVCFKRVSENRSATPTGE